MALGLILLGLGPDAGTDGVRRGLAWLCCAGGVGLSLHGSLLTARALAAVQRACDRLDARPRDDAAARATRPPGPQGLTTSINDATRHIARLEAEARDLRLQLRLSQQQRRNMENVVGHLQDPVLVVDEADRLVLLNGAAERQLGLRWEAVEHERLDDVLPGSADALLACVQEGRRQSEVTRRTWRFHREDTVRFFDCYASCICGPDTAPASVVILLRDITREREVAKIKNDFVSYVSHELKTPLASVTAYIEMLLDGEATDEDMRQDFYKIIQGQAKRLNRLIENILNVSRIESGLLKVTKEPVSLTLLADEQLQMLRGYAEDRDVELVGLKPIVYDRVWADRDMMSQVLVNLLSNAVKYNHPGGTVTVETDVDEAAARVRVQVHDTGVGIPADAVPHVFEKFYRASANQDRAEGSGLGLSLVRQIVEEIHGGRVFVKSQVGTGSTFGFELPLLSTQEAEAGNSVVAEYGLETSI